MDTERLWQAFARQGATLYSGPPRFVGRVEPRWFAILTGEPNLDLNICGLHGSADATDADALLGVVDGVGAPTVIPVSLGVAPATTDVLRAVGFEPLAPEAAMWRPALPLEVAPSPFIVHRAAADDDLADADRILAEAHGTSPGTVDRVFNLDGWRSGRLGCWVAREGTDPVSSVWLTWEGGLVGVWEMMTSPRHRRRGAGRAVLTAALADTAGLGASGHTPVGFSDGPTAVRGARLRGVRRGDPVGPWRHGRRAGADRRGRSNRRVDRRARGPVATATLRACTSTTSLPRWGFATPGRLRDELTGLALAGAKTTTAALVVEFELDGEPLPTPGERQVLVGSADEALAIVETVACRVARLADVDDRHAVDEGEGYADAAEFRVAHERYWNGYVGDLRARLGDPLFAVDDDTLVVLERFRIVARLDIAQGPVTVRVAAPDEIPPLAGVLARAFARDPMVTWPLVTTGDLPARIRTSFDIVDTAFAAEGWIYAAADGLGVMSLLPPGSADLEARLGREIAPRLAALTPDGGARYDAFWSWIWSMLPDEPHWLLDQVAVEPAAQGRGIGSALIRHAVARADADRLPLFLETGVASRTSPSTAGTGSGSWRRMTRPVVVRTSGSCAEIRPDAPPRVARRRRRVAGSGWLAHPCAMTTPWFGLHLPLYTFPDTPTDRLFDHVVEQARAAETAGFGLVTVMDHLNQIPGVGRPDEPMLEAWSVLAALARETKRVRLGTLVTGVTYRNPALLAKTATTLDVISGGRAVFGLGAAWYEAEHDAFGFDFPRIGERMDRLDEALTIARAMFTNERSSFDGRHYTTRDVLNIPQPVQPGGPRIMVGGGGEQRTLKIAAKHADLTHWFPLGFDVLARKTGILAGYCEAIGRDPGDHRAHDGGPRAGGRGRRRRGADASDAPRGAPRARHGRHAGTGRRRAAPLPRCRLHRLHLQQQHLPHTRADRRPRRAPAADRGVGDHGHLTRRAPDLRSGPAAVIRGAAPARR